MKSQSYHLEKVNDKKEMHFNAFIGNLKTHEMKIMAREDREPQKKVGVVFQAFLREHKKKSVATPTISGDEHKDDDNSLYL